MNYKYCYSIILITCIQNIHIKKYQIHKMSALVLMNNRYEVVRKLGEGNRAEIYLVRDRNERDIE